MSKKIKDELKKLEAKLKEPGGLMNQLISKHDQPHAVRIENQARQEQANAQADAQAKAQAEQALADAQAKALALADKLTEANAEAEVLTDEERQEHIPSQLQVIEQVLMFKFNKLIEQSHALAGAEEKAHQLTEANAALKAQIADLKQAQTVADTQKAQALDDAEQLAHQLTEANQANAALKARIAAMEKNQAMANTQKALALEDTQQKAHPLTEVNETNSALDARDAVSEKAQPEAGSIEEMHALNAQFLSISAQFMAASAAYALQTEKALHPSEVALPEELQALNAELKVILAQSKKCLGANELKMNEKLAALQAGWDLELTEQAQELADPLTLIPTGDTLHHTAIDNQPASAQAALVGAPPSYDTLSL